MSGAVKDALAAFARQLIAAQERLDQIDGDVTEEMMIEEFSKVIGPVAVENETLKRQAYELERQERIRRKEARQRGDAPISILVKTDDIEGVVNQAEQALKMLGGVYVRARDLVEVVYDKSAPDWLRRPKGTPVIVAIASDRLRELLDKAADWSKLSRDRDRWVPCAVPPWVVKTLMTRKQWNLPSLEGIVNAPTLRTDGTVLDREGYDAATRLIYDPGSTAFPAIDAEPTREDAVEAYEALSAPFVDFPFLDESDRVAVIAAILSIVGRPAIDGCVPMFYFGAPTPGSGKGLLCDAATLVATGRISEKMANTEHDEEWRKRLLAFALASPQTLVVDNASGAFGSDVLAMSLTTGLVTDRLMGVMQSVSATIRFVTMLTGNNISFVRDMGRRVVPIGLDPKVEHPEDRTDFKYPRLLDYIRENRESLYMSALTILRAYVVAGRPHHGKPPMGSFESWDALVRGATVWVSGTDPLGGVARIRQDGDADRDDLRKLLAAWRTVFGETSVSVSEALAEGEKYQFDGDKRVLREALLQFDSRLDAKALGFAIKKLDGRIADGLSFKRGDKSKRGVTWTVVGASPAP